MPPTPLGTRLRVVPVYPDVTKRLEEWLFACVISQSPNEQLTDVTKPCLHVFCLPDLALEYADGLYAVDDKMVIQETAIDWPVLSVALSMAVKA